MKTWYLLVLVILSFGLLPFNLVFAQQEITVPSDFPSNLSPLKQYKLGFSANMAQCHSGFHLMLKKENGVFACVSNETANKLFERGWGIFPLAGLPLHSETSQNATLPASFMPCNTPFPQSNDSTPVLYMPLNSVGKICLKYYNGNDFPATISKLRIFDPSNNYQIPANITIWSDSSNDTISKGYFFVVYWIKTGNQTGFYGMTTTSCAGIPFAVGYDSNSRMTANDFPFLGVAASCAASILYPEIDSMTGIDVKYIQ